MLLYNVKWLQHCKCIHGDFINYYGASMIAADKENRHNLYNIQTQLTYFDKHLIEKDLNESLSYSLPFRAIPATTLLYMPLVTMENPVSYKLIAFATISYALFAASVVFLSDNKWLNTWLLMFNPALTAGFSGQPSLVIAATLGWIMHFILTSSYTNAGFLMAVLLIKPQFFTVVVPLLVITKFHRKLVMGFLTGSTIMYLVSAIIMDRLFWIKEYFQLVASTESGSYGSFGGIQYAIQHAILNISEAITHNSSWTIPILLSVLLYGVLLWDLSKKADLEEKIIKAVFVGVLFSYHLYLHDLALLTIPIAFMLKNSLYFKTRVSTLIVFTIIAIPSIELAIDWPKAASFITLTMTALVYVYYFVRTKIYENSSE